MSFRTLVVNVSAISQYNHRYIKPIITTSVPPFLLLFVSYMFFVQNMMRVEKGFLFLMRDSVFFG